MGRKKEKFHAYTDGSCFMHEGRMGIGWVISRESNGKYLPGMQRLVYRGKPSSSLAEIYAVVSALEKIDEKSTVIVHTDDLALSNLIKCGDVFRNAQSVKKPRLEALTSLFNAIRRHDTVTAVHEKQGNSAHMTKAHHLSRAACILRPKDVLTSAQPAS